MSVEAALYPPELNTTWPQPADLLTEGDDHIRLTKTVLKTTFANVWGPVTATHTQLNYLAGVTSAIQAQLDGKGAIAGQTWTGTHAFPSTTTIGTVTPTKFGYLATITSDVQAQLNGKGDIAGQVWAGAQDFSGASVVLAPTRTAGESSSAVATTAFVANAALSSSLPGQAGNSGKFITTDGSNPSWAALPPAVIPAGPTIVGPVTITGSISVNGPETGAVEAIAASTIDCSKANYFTKTVVGGITFAFSNVPTGVRYGCIVRVTHTSGVIAWPASVKWAGGIAPAGTAGKVHLFYLLTEDGTTFRGSALLDYAS